MAQYRTIWLSDTHLGTRDCQAQALLDFIGAHECEYLYLVGDIIDFWRLKRAPHWPPLHSDVIRKILARARGGTVVTLVPGNHDEYLRRFCDLQLGNIAVAREAVHRTADGRRLMVVHGHEFDGKARCPRWVAITGDVGYDALLVLNRWFNRARRARGLPYWSVSAHLKGKVKRAVTFITAFETALAREASRRDLQGVVCGHIHARRCGRSTASCTATPETGSRAARRWSNTWTARSSCSRCRPPSPTCSPRAWP
jgi:UDP-2,3-diacylglucosamine pyrophosphatase LpxH